jgi:hypothetical protein
MVVVDLPNIHSKATHPTLPLVSNFQLIHKCMENKNANIINRAIIAPTHHKDKATVHLNLLMTTRLHQAILPTAAHLDMVLHSSLITIMHHNMDSIIMHHLHKDSMTTNAMEHIPHSNIKEDMVDKSHSQAHTALQALEPTHMDQTELEMESEVSARLF